MTTITVENVLPEVFAENPPISDIWQQQVSFERGQNYLIEAESGKGKSTFCSYILGYRHDYSGRVLFGGKDSRRLAVKEWVQVRERRVSCLFQELRLFPELTAYENVAIKNRLTRHKKRQEIEVWFERLGIADKRDALVGRMSFGQQQRVALMRALVQPFDFLLADEPVSHLDDHNASLMGEILAEEARLQGASVIATSIGKHIPLHYDITLKL